MSEQNAALSQNTSTNSEQKSSLLRKITTIFGIIGGIGLILVGIVNDELPEILTNAVTL